MVVCATQCTLPSLAVGCFLGLVAGFGLAVIIMMKRGE